MTENLKCPECGSDNLMYREEAYLYRTVLGRASNGDLLIQGSWTTSEGDNGELTCNDCLHDWKDDKELNCAQFI